ncbi:IclR family transcriptional regulator [Lentzea sp. NPDC051213]|uniref:IclR family transcriptional regulator n=1 Tax=Lentzea sp. NPDC051213 TaxID=3364126 RepID=UPI0037B3D7C3
MVIQRPIKSVKSVNRALLVLSELQSAESPMRLTELSRRLGLAKSTTHRMLSTLLSSGLVLRLGSYYRPAQITAATQPADDARRLLMRRLAPFLGDLLIRTGLSASLAVLDETEVEFVHQVYSHNDIPSPSDGSGRSPAWQTAAGRVLLAFDRLATRQVVQQMALPADEVIELLAELARIRQQRFSEVRNPRGTTCVAVLLRLPQLPATALVLRGLSSQVDLDRALLWLRRVSDAATRDALRAA